MTIPEPASMPSKDDWGDIERYDLDASHAYKRFFGKTLGEVLSYFEDPVLPVIEGSSLHSSQCLQILRFSIKAISFI